MASNAGTFGIYVAVSYDVIAATNSSPQTTEINASKRVRTLMKWVAIGTVQAAGFGILGAWMEIKDGNPWWPPLLGSFLGLGLLYAQYVYAARCGLQQPGPPTEYEPVPENGSRATFAV